MGRKFFLPTKISPPRWEKIGLSLVGDEPTGEDPKWFPPGGFHTSLNGGGGLFYNPQKLGVLAVRKKSSSLRGKKWFF